MKLDMIGEGGRLVTMEISRDEVMKRIAREGERLAAQQGAIALRAELHARGMRRAASVMRDTYPATSRVEFHPTGTVQPRPADGQQVASARMWAPEADVFVVEALVDRYNLSVMAADVQRLAELMLADEERCAAVRALAATLVEERPETDAEVAREGRGPAIAAVYDLIAATFPEEALRLWVIHRDHERRRATGLTGS